MSSTLNSESSPKELTGRVGSIVASRRELGWRADWFGNSLNVSVVPAEGRTAIRLEQKTRGFAAFTTLGTLAMGALAAPFVAIAAANLMDRRTPGWVRALGLNLYLHRSDTRLIAIGVGVLAVLAAIPIGRSLNRWFARHTERRLRLLTEAVGAKVQLAIHEDEARTGA